MPKLTKKLREIITNKSIRTMFQPIVNLKTGNVLGYEALTRGPEGSGLENPLQLFNLARENNMLFELEKVAREQALFKTKKLNSSYNIFINIDPKVVYDKNFQSGVTKDILEQLSISQENIVIELTEQTCIDDFEAFKLALSNYLKQGYKIAIDDTGAGYSGLQSLVSISYDYIKLDHSLVNNIDKDQVKQNLLKSLLDFAGNIDSKIIAEGIETEEEFKTLLQLGITYGQGYFIAYPQEKFQKKLNFHKKISSKVISASNKFSQPKNQIKDLIDEKTNKTVSYTEKNKEVANYFKSNSDLNSVVVLKAGQPQGLIMRNQFYFRLGSRYGYAIFINKTVTSIMKTDSLIVDYRMSITEVSQLAMEREINNLYDCIIITKNNKFMGTVSIKDLLEKLTYFKVEEAKNLNPLTNLPGNRFIKEEIKDRINSPENFSFLYIDLDNFKAYNDCYGYQKGDQVINFTANVLRDTVDNLGSNDDFIGHIGGDDFVIITDYNKDETLSKDIIEKFKQGITNFFSDVDLERGYMLLEDKSGAVYKTPLTSLSIAIVSDKHRKIESPIQVSDIAAEIKKEAKKNPYSNFLKAIQTV